MARPDLRLVTPPETLPVTLDQAKAQLNLPDTSQWDDAIGDLIGTATADLDGKSGSLFRCLMPQVWVQCLDYAFPTCADGIILLPLGPVRSVASITYVDTAGATQTLDPGSYDFFAADGLDDAFLAPAYNGTWPGDVRRQRRAISITYAAGYASASNVPKPIKQAILMHVTHLHENRGVTGPAMPELPMAYCSLINKFTRTIV